MSLDYTLFKVINDLAGQNVFLDWLGKFCAQYLIWVMLGILLIFVFIYKNREQKVAKRIIFLKTFLGAILLLVINYLISFLWFRPRPFVDFPVNQLIEKSPLEKSFPSDHTSLAFMMALTIFFYNKKLGVLLLLLASLVSLARIYVGVHFPLDILGGLVIAFLVVFLIFIIEKKKLKWLSKGKFNLFIFKIRK